MAVYLETYDKMSNDVIKAETHENYNGNGKEVTALTRLHARPITVDGFPPKRTEIEFIVDSL